MRYAPPLTDQQLPPGLSGAFKIAALYAVVAGLWILFSDRLVATLSSDPATLTRLQTLKGGFFVIVTASLLYALIRRAIGAVEDAASRSAFLSDASRTLASSLDYSTTLQSVTRLAVPAFADYCIVDVDEGGETRRLATAHRDPEKEALVRELQRYPPHPEKQLGVSEVLSRGESKLLPTTPDALLQVIAQDAEHLRILRALGPRSTVIVPLFTRERALGAITFVSAESGRRYGPRDLPLFEELARRAALAVDNARLYSEAREARTQAEAATRARDEVLSIVAHDLRDPLNTVALNAGLLLELVPDEKPIEQKYLEIIQRSVGRANRLIADLLDVARIDAGRLSIERERIEVAQLLTEAHEALEPRAREKSLQLDCVLLEDLPTIYADHRRLLQVLSNLLGNALKFTPENGRITLRAGSVEEEVRFSVSDTGPGIPEEDRPYLFQRFWQARRAHRAGAGLGLAIAKGIIEAHGGRIWVETRVGEGSTFYFTIPVVDAEAARRPEVAG